LAKSVRICDGSFAALRVLDFTLTKTNLIFSG